MSSLHERYDELMGYRKEARQKYGASRWYQIYGPPTKLRYPQASVGKRPSRRHVSVGPFSLIEIGAVEPTVVGIIERWAEPGSILELGPGVGELAGFLRGRFPTKIANYFGIERDRQVDGPYAKVDDPASITTGIDLVIASEVVEHMPADEFAGFLEMWRPALRPGAKFVASLPNVLAPTSMERDFTHVQGWPWYDFYAVLRLTFREVAVYRTYHVCGASRVLLLPIRMLLTRALEQDWCEGLLFVAGDTVSTNGR